jgi:hypothetical protein
VGSRRSSDGDSGSGAAPGVRVDATPVGAGLASTGVTVLLAKLLAAGTPLSSWEGVNLTCLGASIAADSDNRVAAGVSAASAKPGLTAESSFGPVGREVAAAVVSLTGGSENSANGVAD